jgi:hypothetical protein
MPPPDWILNFGRKKWNPLLTLLLLRHTNGSMFGVAIQRINNGDWRGMGEWEIVFRNEIPLSTN